MSVVAIIGSGPLKDIPDICTYRKKVDIWIGADRGALTIIERGLPLHYAVGDFDSVTSKQKKLIYTHAKHKKVYSEIKNETDLELALRVAIELNASKVYLFGMTGGRLDHTLVNLQLLTTLLNKNIQGVIIDRCNRVELKKPGTYLINKHDAYSYISFVPFTDNVKGVSLTDFIYPLSNYDLNLGSTRCISNELSSNRATVSFEEGLLLFIYSTDDYS